MNRVGTLFVIAGTLLLASAPQARAQILYSVQNLSSPILENFDSMGNLKEGQLPDGWHMGATTSFGLAKSHTDYSAGTTDNVLLNAGSTGGTYNFADGDNLTSTDRAAGFLTGAASTQSKSLFLGMVNDSGAIITELHFSYDIEKYRAGKRGTDMKMYYAGEDQNWIEIPEALQHYDLDSSVAVINPPTTISKAVDLTNLTVTPQAQLYLRWVYQPSATDNCQALAIDNVQVNFLQSQQADLLWDGAPGATWDAASTNWKNSSGAHLAWDDNTPNNASFVDGGAGVGNLIAISSSRRTGRLTFDAGAKSYTLSGGSIQLTGAAGIGVIAHSSAVIQSNVQVTSSQTWDIASNLTLSGPLTLNSNVILTKKGAGNLLLTGSQNHAANSQLKMTEGSLHLAANLGATAALVIQGNSNSTDATVILDADQDLLELAISTAAPGLQALNLSSPLTAGAFRSLRIHSPGLSSAKSALSALIRPSPGDGIYDSSLASHPGSAIGIAAINDYVLIRPTRIGDLNLDGLVTISDFIDLSSNFGHANVTWQEGDLNGDGIVSIADFIDLASNFGRSYAGDLIPIADSDHQALDQFAAAHPPAVPEPSLLLVALLGSLPARRLCARRLAHQLSSGS
jgi:hypothetical protein